MSQFINENELVHQTKCPICRSDINHIVGLKRTINPYSDLSVSIIECVNCIHWFTTPMPTQGLLNKLYSYDSEYVNGRGWAEAIVSNISADSLAEETHWVVRALDEDNPGNFLEIGPGDGSLMRKMSQKGWNCYGIDLGGYASSPNVFSSSDELPRISFDAIVFLDVLEHTSDPGGGILQYANFLSPNARIFISVPWSESKRAQSGGVAWEMVRPLGHLHYFSKTSMTILLESHSFSNISFDVPDFHGSYINNLLWAFLSAFYGLCRPSRWKSIKSRFSYLFQLIALFPGVGYDETDQMHVKAVLSIKS